MNGSAFDDLAQRLRTGRGDQLTASLRLRHGTMRDYQALAEFHYLHNRPATAMRVLVLEHDRPSVMARFTGQPGRPMIAGVLVESLPALNCQLRDAALTGRYRGYSNRGTAARLLNAEMRCISRVVVHPQWRGLGLAVRLVRAALRTATTAYTEALAAMGRVHPFFRLAAMREYRRWPLPSDQRISDALRSAGLASWRLADGAGMRRWLSEDGEPQRLVLHELRRWAGRRLTLDDQLRRARDHLLCEPIYYLHANAEANKERQ